MNTRFFILVFVVTLWLTLFSSCNSQQHNEDLKSTLKHYNICLIIDGTDLITGESGIPKLKKGDIIELANTLSCKGVGSLYVGYIDSNADNNAWAIFEWSDTPPIYPGPKPSHEQIKKYSTKIDAYDTAKKKYDDKLSSTLEAFEHDCDNIFNMAYSNEVARQKYGSDINGAVNIAVKFLKSDEVSKSHIILISDGVDNVHKELASIPASIELLIVNTNAAKHQFEQAKEFVTLKQVTNYILK